MKKDRFPDIKIEIRAEGLAKKILGKPAASTPSVYGEEKPEGKNLPNISIKGKNQELQSLLETSNKKPVYTGLIKEAIQELRKAPVDYGAATPGSIQRPERPPRGKGPSDPSDTTPGGLGEYKPIIGPAKTYDNIGYEFQSDDDFDSPTPFSPSNPSPLIGSTSAMDEGAPTETGTRAMGTAPSTMGEGGPQALSKPSKPQPGDPGFTFDMAAGAKRGSLDVNVDPTPSPEDAGTGGPAPTKYVGNLQIPSNIASQGQDAIDEFVKRATTAGSSGDGLLENNMEKAPAPDSMGSQLAPIISKFTKYPLQKSITDMTVQDLVKEAAFELRKDDDDDVDTDPYSIGDRIGNALVAIGAGNLGTRSYKKASKNLVENATKVGAGIDKLYANISGFSASKNKGKDVLNFLQNKFTDASMKDVKVGEKITQQGGKAVKEIITEPKKVGTTLKAEKLLPSIAGGLKKVEGGIANIFKFGKKGLRGTLPKNKYMTLGIAILAGLPEVSLKPIASSLNIDKKDQKVIGDTLSSLAGYANPFDYGPKMPAFSEIQRVFGMGESSKPAPVGVPPGVNMKNIQKAPMVGGAAGQMPKATTMNRPANMGVNVQQPVITGAGTMKNIEKRVAANKPKAVGAPKKTRATKRKGR